jgi:hypothetical protein
MASLTRLDPAGWANQPAGPHVERKRHGTQQTPFLRSPPVKLVREGTAFVNAVYTPGTTTRGSLLWQVADKTDNRSYQESLNFIKGLAKEGLAVKQQRTDYGFTLYSAEPPQKIVTDTPFIPPRLL